MAWPTPKLTSSICSQRGNRPVNQDCLPMASKKQNFFNTFQPCLKKSTKMPTTGGELHDKEGGFEDSYFSTILNKLVSKPGTFGTSYLDGKPAESVATWRRILPVSANQVQRKNVTNPNNLGSLHSGETRLSPIPTRTGCPIVRNSTCPKATPHLVWNVHTTITTFITAKADFNLVSTGRPSRQTMEKLSLSSACRSTKNTVDILDESLWFSAEVMQSLHSPSVDIHPPFQDIDSGGILASHGIVNSLLPRNESPAKTPLVEALRTRGTQAWVKALVWHSFPVSSRL